MYSCSWFTRVVKREAGSERRGGEANGEINKLNRSASAFPSALSLSAEHKRNAGGRFMRVTLATRRN